MSTNAPASSDSSQQITAYRWVLAFAVMGLILWLISRWRVGYTFLYYLATLMLVFILLTQYQAITALLSPFNSLPGGQKPS
jgi:hypothetical protein